MEREELVRRCAYAVAVATGVDPFASMDDRTRSDDSVQIARKLWAQLVVTVLGVNHTQAARLLNRHRETVIINLTEVMDWADPEMHPRGNQFGVALDEMSEALAQLLSGALATARAAPTPIERSKINRKRQARAQ